MSARRVLHRLSPAVRRRAALAAALVALLSAPAGAQKAEKTALRCWRCGEVFTVLQQASAGRCPACRTVCRRVEEPGLLKIHCLDAGASGCSFVCRCPGGETAVFVGGRDGEGERIAGYLAELGVGEIAVLIGAEPEGGCLRSVVELMRRFKVAQLFDPGFGSGEARYAEYIDLLRREEVDYRVVRAMENLALGPVRMYVVRAGSFGDEAAGGRRVSLCIVHGGNSFLLSRGARAGAAPAQPPVDAALPGFLFTGDVAELKACGAPYGPRGALVLESNGVGIGVKQFGRITVASAGGSDAGGGPGPPAQGAAAARSASKERININSASAQELDALSGIGAAKAAMIVEFRQANGRFNRIEDLKKVPGIGEKLFQRNRDRICVD
ncbi:MAG TPA: helix-hairpin-helix domain-containing protein [bacterium]|nr:helix-hairpin-helix domain-containing protein [bacterium]